MEYREYESGEDAQVLQNPLVQGKVFRDPGSEVLRTGEAHGEIQLGKGVLHIGIFHGGAYGIGKALRHSGVHVGRADDAEVDRGGEIIAQLFKGRDVRIRRVALVAGNGQQADAAVIGRALEGGQVDGYGVNVAADQLGNGGGGTAVGGVVPLYAGLLANGGNQKMGGAVGAGGNIGHAAGGGGGRVNQVLQGLIGAAGGNSESDGNLGDDADGSGGLPGIAHFVDLGIDEVAAVGADGQRVAIGLAVYGLGGTGGTAAALHILYDHVDTKVIAQLSGQGAGQQIGGAAGGIGNDEGDVLLGEVQRGAVRRSRSGSSGGSGLVGAAGARCKREERGRCHQGNQEPFASLFHDSSSSYISAATDRSRHKR